MSLRILGAIVTLLGAFLAVSSLWALSLSNPLAPPGSPQQWLLHWRLWGWVTLVLGLVTVAGGIGVFFLKRWSFLLLFGVAILVAVVPWLFVAAGAARFAYEAPSVWESALFLAIGLCALVGHLHLRRTHVRT
jgi:hypothetical protein